MEREKMGNLELQKMMIDKFRISMSQASELGTKIDNYIKNFEDEHLYKELCKYIQEELKKEYNPKKIGEKNIKRIARSYLDKKNDWENSEGYYSFVGYILTIIGQITSFLPSELVGKITFVAIAVTVLILNQMTMKIARNHSKFIKEFNNNFPSMIILSVLICLLIVFFDWGMYASIGAVLGINILLSMFVLCVKGGK